jgi:acetyl-CoA carboxylase biotin carboxyl carrier protein
VAVGDVITAGQTVGLLEVMKTFNRVTYGDGDGPDRARVRAIRPGDGDDLAGGDVILELEPA